MCEFNQQGRRPREKSHNKEKTLHNEEFPNSTLHQIRKIRPRNMRWSWHVGYVGGEYLMYVGLRLENQNERDH
jgi:hypothetical protein